MLNIALDIIKPLNTSGQWNGNTYAQNGGTFVIGDDGSITVNGTFTNTTYLYLGDFVVGENVVKINGYQGPYTSMLTLTAIAGSTWYTVSSDDGREIPANTTVSVRIYAATGATASNAVFHPMIRFASDTDATFESYKSITTLHINWQSEAGTIYGGTVTLNEDGSADVVDSMYYDVLNGDVNITTASVAIGANYSKFYYRLSVLRNNSGSAFCSSLVRENSTGLTSENKYSFDGADYTHINLSNALTGIDSGVDTKTTAISKFKSYLANNPIEFAYTRATSITYHFDNIGQLYTFLGTNNVWTDTGDVTVTYIANAAKFSFGSPLHTYNYVNLKLFGNTYIEHGKG